MRIIVMADSHGSGSAVTKIVEKNIDTAEMFIHLGDGENDMTEVLEKYPDIKLYRIRGNCDHSPDLPIMEVIRVEAGLAKRPVGILAVHGHLHYVEWGKFELVRLAKENGCEIALFGHTHCRFNEEDDGVMLVNPGSCAKPRDDSPPSYACIDITGAGVITGIVDLTD